MRLFRPLLAGLLFLAVGAAADPLQQILAKMSQESAVFRGLTADMKRVIHTAVLNEDEVQTGTLVVKRPKPRQFRALLDLKKPNVRQVSYSGHTVEIYYPASNLIQKYDINKKLGSQVDKYLLLGFGASPRDLQEAYNIAYGDQGMMEGQETTRLVLTPKQPDRATGLTKAELWVSNKLGIALQQKLYFSGGDYQLATYTNVKINPDIPDSAIQLKTLPNPKIEEPQK